MEPHYVHGLPRRLPDDVSVIGIPPFSTPVVDDEDDSFFELELAVPYSSDTSICTTTTTTTDSICFVPSASPGDKFLSKRKILPIEGLNRPHSPISLLKSAPKFRVFPFTQSKSTAATENAEAGDKRGKNRGNGLATLKRSGSSRNSDSPDFIGGSKSFSREVIQKYLRLLKPLYVRVAKKNGDRGETVSLVGPTSSTSPPYPTVSGKGKPPTGPPRSKQLGKCRSASAATTTPARMDDSLAQLQDGIQSAILHCKRSLSASRDFSPLSRCDAGSAHDGKSTDGLIS